MTTIGEFYRNWIWREQRADCCFRHCPSGVPEPTTPPAESAETGASATATAAVSTANSASASTTEATTCEPHGDHWHCPSGVAEPTTPPSATATGEDHDHDHEEDEHDHEATASTCEPHGDHWHCPSGVAEPTTPPAETTGAASRTGTTSGANSAESAAATSSQFDGAAVAGGPVGSVQMAAAGILGLLVL